MAAQTRPQVRSSRSTGRARDSSRREGLRETRSSRCCRASKMRIPGLHARAAQARRSLRRLRSACTGSSEELLKPRQRHGLSGSSVDAVLFKERPGPVADRSREPSLTASHPQSSRSWNPFGPTAWSNDWSTATHRARRQGRRHVTRRRMGMRRSPSMGTTRNASDIAAEWTTRIEDRESDNLPELADNDLILSKNEIDDDRSVSPSGELTRTAARAASSAIVDSGVGRSMSACRCSRSSSSVWSACSRPACATSSTDNVEVSLDKHPLPCALATTSTRSRCPTMLSGSSRPRNGTISASITIESNLADLFGARSPCSAASVASPPSRASTVVPSPRSRCSIVEARHRADPRAMLEARLQTALAGDLHGSTASSRTHALSRSRAPPTRRSGSSSEIRHGRARRLAAPAPVSLCDDRAHPRAPACESFMGEKLGRDAHLGRTISRPRSGRPM